MRKTNFIAKHGRETLKMKHQNMRRTAVAQANTPVKFPNLTPAQQTSYAAASRSNFGCCTNVAMAYSAISVCVIRSAPLLV